MGLSISVQTDDRAAKVAQLIGLAARLGDEHVALQAQDEAARTPPDSLPGPILIWRCTGA